VSLDESRLVEIGLRVGDRVRFRRKPEEHWKEATVIGRERDGSVGLRDEKGASRAIVVDHIEVRTRGPRGGLGWEPLVDRMARTEQLKLL
jgi:hypothetical protein